MSPAIPVTTENDGRYCVTRLTELTYSGADPSRISYGTKSPNLVNNKDLPFYNSLATDYDSRYLRDTQWEVALIAQTRGYLLP